jgi:hypothetical protein
MAGIRTQEQRFGFSKSPQADINTPNTAGQIIQLSKLNADIAFPTLATEDDAAEMGKSDEWATQHFATSWSTGGSIRKYLTSQIAQWAWSFGLGSVTASDSYTSVIVPRSPVVDGIELPYFSTLQQFRPTQVGGAPLDQLIVGCAIEEIGIEINRGAGRQATQITIGYQGSGKFIEPSGYTMPAAATEKQLQAASASVVINGIDYLANAVKGNLENVRIGLKNNIDTDGGFFIGSGTQTAGDYTSGAIRGRQEYINRVYSLQITTRLSKTSAEFAALRSLTTGSASISLSGGAQDAMTVQFPKVGYSSVVLEDANNIAVLRIDCRIFKDPSLGPIIVSCKNSTIPALGMAS